MDPYIKKREIGVLIFLLVGALFVRIWGVFYATSGDITNHITWGRVGFEHGFMGLYSYPFTQLGVSNLNYPPLTEILFAALYGFFVWWKWFMWQLNIHISIFPSFLLPQLQSSNILTFLLKLPGICADIGIGLFVWKLGKRTPKATFYSTLSMIVLIWFAPTFWYVSALWAQVDSLPLFFLIAALYFLHKKKSLHATLLIALAILSKQTAIIFVPLYFLYVFKEEGIAASIKNCLLLLFTVWIFFVPFISVVQFPLEPFMLYIQKIAFATSSEFVTSYAFNFWSLFVPIRVMTDSALLFGAVSIRFASICITIVVLAIIHISYYVYRKPKDMLFFWHALLLLALTIFFWMTRLHERHMLPVVLFSSLLGLWSNRFKVMALFVSFFQFASLLYVWDVFNVHAERLLNPLSGIKLLVIVFSFYYGVVLISFLKEAFFQKEKAT